MRTRSAQVVCAVALLVLSCPRLASRAAAQSETPDIRLRCVKDVTKDFVVARLYKDAPQSLQDKMQESLTRVSVPGGGIAFHNRQLLGEISFENHVALCVMDSLLIQISSIATHVEIEEPYLIVDFKWIPNGRSPSRYLLSTKHLSALPKDPGVVSIETIPGAKFPQGAVDGVVEGLPARIMPTMVINLGDQKMIPDEILDYGMAWAKGAEVEVWYGKRGSDQRNDLFRIFDLAHALSVEIQWMSKSPPPSTEVVARKDGAVAVGYINGAGGSQRLLLTPEGRVFVEGAKPQDPAPGPKEKAPKQDLSRPLPPPKTAPP